MCVWPSRSREMSVIGHQHQSHQHNRRNLEITLISAERDGHTLRCPYRPHGDREAYDREAYNRPNRFSLTSFWRDLGLREP